MSKENELPEWHKLKLDGPKRKGNNRDFYKKSYYKKHKRTNEGILINSVGYAIAWGLMHKPYSLKELRALCKSDDAPSVFFIEKTWKSYTFYYRELVKRGMEPRPPKNDSERRRQVDVVSGKIIRNILPKDYNIAEFAAKIGVKDKASYIELRKNPVNLPFLPCAKTVVTRFGTWRKFMYEVMKYSVDTTVTRYVEESIEAGYWLKIGDCDKLKIPIRMAMDLLKPRFFNVLCYRKKELIDNSKVLPNVNGEVGNEK